MKKTVLIMVSFLALLLSACSTGGTVTVTMNTESSAQTAAPSDSATSESASPSAEPTPAASASPGDTPEMYTSYAHMTAFDPNTNTASFDYFDMLRGDDAVQWLVDKQGYTLADAQAEVSGYSESEFIEKNTNPQLRTVDLSAVPVTLVVNNDGSLVDNLEPRLVSIDTLKTMYASNPDLLIKPFFYEVKVNGSGQVESVNQVYWP